MATAAQITANRINAQSSTGPRSEAGKAAVAQNATLHGLSSRRFSLLPVEDPAEFQALLASLQTEHAPSTATESFLVLELARAQWRIARTARIEEELLTQAGSTWAAVAEAFCGSSPLGAALARIGRYETAARRAWHGTLNQLLKLQAARDTSEIRRTRALRNEMEAAVHHAMAAPIPVSETAVCETKPIPAHLRRELDAHKRRDPLFNPVSDRSQMSGELQRFFDKGGKQS